MSIGLLLVVKSTAYFPISLLIVTLYNYKHKHELSTFLHFNFIHLLNTHSWLVYLTLGARIVNIQRWSSTRKFTISDNFNWELHNECTMETAGDFQFRFCTTWTLQSEFSNVPSETAPSIRYFIWSYK